MYVCSYAGMHVRMHVCMYVRVKIRIFTYLSFVRTALQVVVVADTTLPRFSSGITSRILGACKHASSLIRRRPDALCNFQGSVTTYIARKRVKRIWTMASKCRTERTRISRKGPFGACIDRRGGWRHVTFAARTGTFGCRSQEKPNVTTFILLSRRFLSPATSHQLDGACS